MASDSRKVLGIVLLFAGVLLASFNTIAVTNLSVLDTDPATYIIVVMLMMFAFIAFSLKEDLHFAFSGSNIAYGGAAFAAYILLVSYLRGSLSFVFGTYRIDALLLPLLISSFVIIIFGFDGLRKLKPLVVYSLFASPLLLMPLLFQNAAFASANAHFVYDTLRLFGAPVSISGVVITSAANTSISIATTCAPLGTFAALALFLIPVAYLYEGKRRGRVLWVFSGLALMLLFNFLRMFAVGFEWAYYGVGQAVGTFHAFAGQILFYATIIIMLLLAGRFGMGIKRIPRHKLSGIWRDLGRMRLGELALPSLAVGVLGVIGFLFSLPYLSSIHASPTYFYGNLSPSTITFVYRVAGGTLARVDSNTVSLGATGIGEVFAMNNASGAGGATYVIATPGSAPRPGRMVTNATSVEGAHSYILRNGITVTGATVRSGNLTFDVNYFSAPYNVSDSYVSVNYEFFVPLNGTAAPSCSMVNYGNIGLFNYIGSVIYNTLSGRPSYSDGGFMCDAYLVANEI